MPKMLACALFVALAATPAFAQVPDTSQVDPPVGTTMRIPPGASVLVLPSTPTSPGLVTVIGVIDKATGAITQPGVQAASSVPAETAVEQPPMASSNSGIGTNPARGANSFSKAQAVQRFEHAGYTNVTNLILDIDGVWRGNATRDNATLGVWLDFKGHIGQL